MAISNEDKKDVARSFGKKAATAISNVTNDARSKAIHAKIKDPQAREDSATSKMLGRAKQKSKGVKMTRKFLDMKKHHDDLTKYETN